MKHLRFCILILILLAVLLTGCQPPKGKKYSTAFGVAENLTYDEKAFREEVAQKKSLPLIVDGDSNYSIVIPDHLDEILFGDVLFLQSALRKISGNPSAFAIRTDPGYATMPCISIGTTSFSSAVDTTAIADDGYVIKSISGNIYIKGSDRQSEAVRNDGVANGIYSFLENQLGCMFVRDDYDYIPYLPTVYLHELNIVSNPDFRWRRIYQYEVSSGNWSRKIKSNGTAATSEFGNDANRYWGTWCHSVFTFVPPEEYFEEHPEFYAYIKGERRYEYNGSLTQLCLTNPDIYPVIEANMQNLMEQYPHAVYWDFSINDNMNYCTCEACERSYEHYGSRAGAMLEIVNKLARKYTEKYISTLAYTYNKDVPRGLRCEPNVNIVIAPIETSQLYSSKFGANEASAEAKRMIEDWSAVSDNLFLWDYVVNFKHLLLPFPNFAVQQDNVEFYKENHVKSVFHQGSREQGDELACLRSYVLARQLWDTDVDVNALIAKYLVVTYGAAAPYLAEYLDLMHDSVATEAKDLDIYDKPSAHRGDYLDKALLARYDALTQQALTATANDAKTHGYVEEIRINVLYAMMHAEGLNVAYKRRAFSEFRTLVERHGITTPTEVTPPDMAEYLTKTYPRHLTQNVLAVVGIAIGCTALAAIAVFAVVWFGVRKKTLHDLKCKFKRPNRKYRGPV